MSKVYATMSGFVGFDGQSVWLGEGDEYDENHPLVKARPGDFTSAKPGTAVVAEEKRRRSGGTRG